MTTTIPRLASLWSNMMPPKWTEDCGTFSQAAPSRAHSEFLDRTLTERLFQRDDPTFRICLKCRAHQLLVTWHHGRHNVHMHKETIDWEHSRSWHKQSRKLTHQLNADLVASSTAELCTSSSLPASITTRTWLPAALQNYVHHHHCQPASLRCKCKFSRLIGSDM